MKGRERRGVDEEAVHCGVDGGYKWEDFLPPAFFRIHIIFSCDMEGCNLRATNVNVNSLHAVILVERIPCDQP
ncbi:hypothetical protein HI914_01010 [Erysiphe necator]|nr:hypothetical protein HI914_01010 [Erysiphe necator]